ncbi:hypothetical protein F2Q68_00005193 [Brassica cretica]|uniref:Uncharacterized protein n=1 Tax=Brassica cretica TaxID=69181 RepID=A0A8S9JC83_BRACR|nr:hypothetical protein F2Q68_00005193 [Brassica cretica]
MIYGSKEAEHDKVFWRSYQRGIYWLMFKRPQRWLRMLIEELHWSFFFGVIVVYGVSQGLSKVIATGHNDLFPKTIQENLSQYQTEYEKIRFSKSVFIVGGGPSDVELAAEIAVQLQTETKHTGLQERDYTRRLSFPLCWETSVFSMAQWGFVGCLPGLIKSKDLFVGKTRKTRGLNPKLVQD